MRPRFIMFAGPNGSGKSTIKPMVRKMVGNLGIHLNADDIEKKLRINGELKFSDFGLLINKEDWESAYHGSLFEHLKDYLGPDDIRVENNKLFPGERTSSSALATLTAEFIRNHLVKTGKNFTMETVMSHPSKIEFLKKCQDEGYEIHFFFVTTDFPEINVERVALRVSEGGHDVLEEKIISRYYNSMEQLMDALRLVDFGYLFDNSGRKAIEIASVRRKELTMKLRGNPNWFRKYVLDRLED